MFMKANPFDTIVERNRLFKITLFVGQFWTIQKIVFNTTLEGDASFATGLNFILGCHF